jgi:hypothetical protein
MDKKFLLLFSKRSAPCSFLKKRTKKLRSYCEPCWSLRESPDRGERMSGDE